jgi:hypothetical protein
MKLKAMIGTVTAAVLTSAGAHAVDPPNFDFNGYAQIPAAVSGTLTVRSVLTNNGVVPTPIPLDFLTKQYTLVLTATLLSDNGTTQQYGNAVVTIYEDAIGGGTAADYALPASFVDGTPVFQANLLPALTRVTFTATLGSFFAPLQAPIADLFGGWSRTVGGIPAGYDENWDGLIAVAAVGVESRPWQGIKQLYR